MGMPTKIVNVSELKANLAALLAALDQQGVPVYVTQHGKPRAVLVKYDEYEALPEGQMAMIPGTSHGVKKEKPGLVNRMILDFLADETLPSALKTVRTGS